MSTNYDSVDVYVQGIRQYKQITIDKERELSYIILNSNDNKEIDYAIDEMVKANLFFVISRAHKYFRGYHASLSLMDLIAEGNIGLVRAVKKYDATHESKAVFISFAGIVIDQHIEKAIGKDKFIHIPVSHFKYRKQLKDLEKIYGDDLTDDIIKEETELSELYLKYIKAGMESNVSYLDNFFNDKESNWQDYIGEENDDLVSKKSLTEYLNSYIEDLNERQRKVVKGLYLGALTIQELATELKVSRERIRQMGFQALRVLKNKIIKDWEKKNPKKKKKVIMSKRKLWHLSDNLNAYYDFQEEIYKTNQKHAKKIMIHLLER